MSVYVGDKFEDVTNRDLGKQIIEDASSYAEAEY
jgi:hypothetical protein